MKCYIDTDVATDLLYLRQPFVADASALFQAIERGEAKAAVASLTFANAYFVLSKKLDHDDLLSRLDRFRTLVEILAVDEKNIHRALRSNFPDFEDAIQHECAKAHKMDCIVTRDLKDYRTSELPVYSPADALKVIRKNR